MHTHTCTKARERDCTTPKRNDWFIITERLCWHNLKHNRLLKPSDFMIMQNACALKESKFIISATAFYCCMPVSHNLTI